MATPARRRERQDSILELVDRAAGGGVRRIALEGFEEEGVYLEGTGSLVLDRAAGVAFACRSVRTSDRVLEAWAAATGFDVVRFDAVDGGGGAIYHTNVVMAVGERFAVVCSGCVPEAGQRRGLLERLAWMREMVLDISPAQMWGMCGNILELRAVGGTPVVAMSETAWGCVHAGAAPCAGRVCVPGGGGDPDDRTGGRGERAVHDRGVGHERLNAI